MRCDRGRLGGSLEPSKNFHYKEHDTGVVLANKLGVVRCGVCACCAYARLRCGQETRIGKRGALSEEAGASVKSLD